MREATNTTTTAAQPVTLHVQVPAGLRADLVVHDPAATTPSEIPDPATEAQAHAVQLWAEVKRRRAELAERIGQRGILVGTITTPDGQTFDIHAESPKGLNKVFRHFPSTIVGNINSEYRARARNAVRLACARWDEAAEAEGLGTLQREAQAAGNRYRALVRGV